MLILYYKPYCPYSQRVIAANERIKAPLVLMDITLGAAAKAVLLQNGGKIQVPFLDDTERSVSLYESLDIIDYLQTYYGNGSKPVVEPMANVCPIE